MENKRLSVVLIIISLVFAGFLLYFNSSLTEQAEELNCSPSEACQQIENSISVTHIGFGFFGFMLALGVYILLFNKSEERILKRLEDEKDKSLGEEKFDILMKALDDSERKVMKAVKEQDGITQNTLRLRTNLSKAKLSYVLQELERRGLIKRKEKQKTLEVWSRV